MQATLYLPGQAPQLVSTTGLTLPDPNSGYAYPTQAVATLLECRVEALDVLATGLAYVVWTVFDFEEGPANLAAMAEVGRLTGMAFEPEDETAELRGPVLVLH
ncbi:MAG: hypothetical protein EOO55_02135 [Hymenobacter sp.]|nr:MAG: hypothetical protein EOO55_02135 [Hymenobacter sp.]